MWFGDDASDIIIFVKKESNLKIRKKVLSKNLKILFFWTFTETVDLWYQKIVGSNLNTIKTSINPQWSSALKIFPIILYITWKGIFIRYGFILLVLTFVNSVKSSLHFGAKGFQVKGGSEAMVDWATFRPAILN